MAFIKQYRTALIAILVIAIVLAFLVPAVRGPVIPSIIIKASPLKATVIASGRVEAANRFSVSSRVQGVVRQVLVSEGSAIKAGDVLVKLQSEESGADMASAKARVALAEARLRRVAEFDAPLAGSKLKQAEIALQQAQRHEANVARLFSGRNASAEELAVAKETTQQRQQELSTARLDVKNRQRGGIAEQEARASLADARAALAAARARTADWELVSPVDGILIRRTVEPGQLARPGDELLVVAPSFVREIRVDLDEKNLQFIQEGQPARVLADAYPDKPFDVSLFRIAPGIDADRGTVELRFRATKWPDFLREDMTVSVEMLTASRKAALVVPTDALFSLSGATHVWCLRKYRVQHCKVTAGLRSNDQVEIMQGLSVGDVVLLPGSMILSPGDRVRTEEMQ